MKYVVFLVEETSMQVLLNALLPRLLPNLQFQCIPHEGKHDLEKSIPRKLKAWRTPGVHFCVIRDNDGADCLELKRKLVALCKSNGRPDTLVRIACQELEAWYLGEPDALADAFENESLRGLERKRKYRNSDLVQRPSAEIERLVPEFSKVSGARRMARHLTRERNQSASFRIFMDGLEDFVREFGIAPDQT